MTHLGRGGGHRRGFVLVATAISMVALLTVAGLATDITRIYVARSELQIFVDEAALAAAFELDGTSAGITRANTVASSGPGTTPNRWYFDTQAVTGVVTKFSAASSGPYVANPALPAGQRFIQVTATGAVPLYFLPLVPGIPVSKTITVSAKAGQSRKDAVSGGIEPLTPMAHSVNDVNFGFSAGQLYTLRWGPPGDVKKGEVCPGDVGFAPIDSANRGYVDVGQGSGASNVRNAIVNNDFFLPAPLEEGSFLKLLSGQQSVPDAVEERFNQDTDITSVTYSNYHGNGRRFMEVAVNDGNDPARVVGFALFFLPPSPCGDKNVTACCAEFVGAAVVGGTRRGAGAPGIYDVKLVE